jgi:predicted permease
MGSIVLDVRYAFRSLVRRPGYALLTIGVLALAIACNTTVFSALNAFLLRPLPYPDDDGIVMVFNSFPKMGLATGGSSIPDYLDRRAQAPSLADLAIVTPASRALTGGATAEQLSVVRASPSLFNVLGVPAALGRVFTEQEATIGNERVVILSDALWRTRFGARADLVGSDVELDGQAHRVVGVMPASFGFPDRNVDAWLPFAFTPQQTTDQERGNDFSTTVGRLKADATLDELNAELDAIAQRQIGLYPGGGAFMEATGFTGRAQSLREYIVDDTERTLYLLQGIVLAVLLIACANISSLQLARVIARRKEIAIRSSLGADRRRIARLVLVEMLVLIAAGMAGAFVLARGGIGLLRWLGLDESSQGIHILLDGRVALFNVGVAVLAALVAGLAPLISLLRSGLAASARDAGLGGDDRAAHVLSNALVVVQIALCFALLVGAGLLTKSFYRMQAEGPGFGADGLLTAKVALPRARYPDSAAHVRFFDLLLPKLSALPGVTAVGYTSALPFGGEGLGASVSIDGYEVPAGAPPPGAMLQSINDGYLPALGIPVVRGRNFAVTEPERVAIVDEIFAALYWPDKEPIGQRVQVGEGGEEWYTVVGVVAAVKVSSLAHRSDAGTIYWHYTQQPTNGGFVALRTALTPASLAQTAAREVASVDPDVPLFDSLTMNARIADSLGEQRAPMALTAVFAAVAFTLSIVGIYGVLAWVVTRRTSEIGVRMALGARAPDVLGMVLKQAGKLVAVGLAGGIVCALALGRFISSEVYDVSVTDPFVFASALVGLSAAAFAASWLPARHAARLDPLVALRCD